MVKNCLVLARVTKVQGTSLYYPCCQQCNSKIFQVEKGWSCSKCSNQVSREALHYRYRLSLTVCDSKSQCCVTVFGTTLDNFIGCQADTLHRWLQETGNTEDELQSCLDDTFTGNMFLFGFKLNLSRRKSTTKCVPLSLDDVSILSGASQYPKSQSTSLIAYQMLYPNDIIQQDSQTLFDKLKYQRLVALGRIPAGALVQPQSNFDSFVQSKACQESGNLQKPYYDDQDSIELSCGSFSRTTFNFSGNDESSVARKSCQLSILNDLETTKNCSQFDFYSQPSIEIPRTSKLSMSNYLEYQCDSNDVPAIAEQSQDQENSMHIMHQKLNNESAFDELTCVGLQSEITEVPFFKFSMKDDSMKEESISDSILMQANDMEMSGDHKSNISHKENICGVSSAEVVREDWTCIPESEELAEFLDQFQSEAIHSAISGVSHASNKHTSHKANTHISLKSTNELGSEASNASVTCYPMSEDLEAFLSDATESPHEETDKDDAQRQSSGDETVSEECSIEQRTAIPESEETINSPNASLSDSPSPTKSKSSEHQTVCEETPTEISSSSVQKNENNFESDLWDDGVSSQNLLNAMAGLAVQNCEVQELKRVNDSSVIVESEDLFASFNQGPMEQDPPKHSHSSTPNSGPSVIINCTSTKKGVRFAKSLLQSQTLAHIDHLMQTTPMSLQSVSRRSSCLKIKPPADSIHDLESPGKPDLSQDLFSPSPIASNAARSSNRSSSSVQSKYFNQSTPRTNSLEKVSASRSHVSESTRQSDSLTDSMDLFSDSSYNVSCSKSRTGNTSHSRDLFSDGSFYEDPHNVLCKKLF